VSSIVLAVLVLVVAGILLCDTATAVVVSRCCLLCIACCVSGLVASSTFVSGLL